MERKKLVTRMVLIAIIVFIVSGGGLVFESLYDNLLKSKEKERKNERLAELTAYYQKYLDETAAKITEVPVKPQVISKIKSDIFRDMAKTRAYLWMSRGSGEFVFGIPHPVFARLNGIFDKNRSAVEAEGYYVDRNDFLLKLVEKHSEIRSSNFQPDGRERFYFPGGLTVVLSSPVMNGEHGVIGDLYLKVNDYAYRDYYNQNVDTMYSFVFPAVHVIFGASALLLWLLLPTWVYVDGRQRDVKRAFLWAILTAVSVGFASLVYLVTRPASVKVFLCPECRKELNGTRAFCPYCGMDLSSTICRQCQYPIKPEWHFCPSCRCDLTQEPEEEAAGVQSQSVEAPK